jgi:hypothetical protein
MAAPSRENELSQCYGAFSGKQEAITPVDMSADHPDKPE